MGEINIPLSKEEEKNKIQFLKNKKIAKIGLDTDVLVALIEKDKEINLSKPKHFINKGVCYAYQLIVNQAIGVLIHKRGYEKKFAISKTLNYLNVNKITIFKEHEISKEKRDNIINDLRIQRRRIRKDSKPEDSDLDILASYKTKNVNRILTMNYFHFIDLGKYLGMQIERVWYKKAKESNKISNMLKNLFWTRNKKFRQPR
ncbi:hypothetical protein CMI42_05825 [Candidatus Pacearchaeota archaeon]|nr:hypothetical protein [Candidatus Pacearchaeota archaeon]|tara:strand:+ start:880 stop:1485 length:606 start_codon:yes stop_codon:yes gene_type:complete